MSLTVQVCLYANSADTLCVMAKVELCSGKRTYVVSTLLLGYVLRIEARGLYVTAVPISGIRPLLPCYN